MAAAVLRSARAVDQTLRALRQQERSFDAASEKAVQQIIPASDALSRHATELSEAAADLERRARKLEDRKAVLARRTTIKEAALITETLESLAVDMTRLLDAQGAEALWEKYYRGDRGIFARRLLRQRDIAGMRRKYERDREFRDFVNRYREAYEEMMDDIGAIEHGSVLEPALATSDVGKLYTLLKEAFG